MEEREPARNEPAGEAGGKAADLADRAAAPETVEATSSLPLVAGAILLAIGLILLIAFLTMHVRAPRAQAGRSSPVFLILALVGAVLMAGGGYLLAERLIGGSGEEERPREIAKQDQPAPTREPGEDENVSNRASHALPMNSIAPGPTDLTTGSLGNDLMTDPPAPGLTREEMVGRWYYEQDCRSPFTLARDGTVLDGTQVVGSWSFSESRSPTLTGNVGGLDFNHWVERLPDGSFNLLPQNMDVWARSFTLYRCM